MNDPIAAIKEVAAETSLTIDIHLLDEHQRRGVIDAICDVHRRMKMLPLRHLSVTTRKQGMGARIYTGGKKQYIFVNPDMIDYVAPDDLEASAAVEYELAYKATTIGLARHACHEFARYPGANDEIRRRIGDRASFDFDRRFRLGGWNNATKRALKVSALTRRWTIVEEFLTEALLDVHYDPAKGARSPIHQAVLEAFTWSFRSRDALESVVEKPESTEPAIQTLSRSLVDGLGNLGRKLMGPDRA